MSIIDPHYCQYCCANNVYLFEILPSVAFEYKDVIIAAIYFQSGFKSLSRSPSSSSVSLTWSLSNTIKVLHAGIIQITATEMNAEALLKIAEFVCWLYAVIDFPH